MSCNSENLKPQLAVAEAGGPPIDPDWPDDLIFLAEQLSDDAIRLSEAYPSAGPMSVSAAAAISESRRRGRGWGRMISAAAVLLVALTSAALLHSPDDSQPTAAVVPASVIPAAPVAQTGPLEPGALELPIFSGVTGLVSVEKPQRPTGFSPVMLMSAGVRSKATAPLAGDCYYFRLDPCEQEGSIDAMLVAGQKQPSVDL